jgi:hypothetical protein
MEPTREQSFQPPLTLDMIKPTPDNMIPPNGIFPKRDEELGRLFTNFENSPQDPNARLEYLRYIARIGDNSSARTYLSMISSPKFQELSGILKLEETQLLADLFMNAAEAAKRRNEYYVQEGASEETAKIMGGNPLEYLKYSLQYREALKN